MPMMTRTEMLEIALRQIQAARDLHAETGEYPEFADGGPDRDQRFDDWAADVAAHALDNSNPCESYIQSAARLYRASRNTLERHVWASWFASQPCGVPRCMVGWYQEEEDTATLMHWHKKAPTG